MLNVVITPICFCLPATGINLIQFPAINTHAAILICQIHSVTYFGGTIELFI